MHILYVEDEVQLQEHFERLLIGQGHRVTIFDNVPEALAWARTTQPDVLLCDYKLVGSPNGLALAEQMRNLYPACTIVMMSYYTETDDVIRAMQLGVDDYIRRPVKFTEMLNRLHQAVARRQNWGRPTAPQVIRCGPLTLDSARRTATWHAEPLQLTPTEFALLFQLASRPGHVFSAVDLCSTAKGIRVDRSRAGDLLKQHIFQLRAKLEQSGRFTQPIQSVRGHGYRWALEDEESDA